MFEEKDLEPKEEAEQSVEEASQNEVNDTEANVSGNQEKDQSEQCIAEVSIWKDQCRRISAEFENFKKRTERDQARWAEMAKEAVLNDLLTLVDDFDRAMRQDSADITGIEMMHNAFIKLLENHGVSVIQTYETFDPLYHEAIMQVDSDAHEAGQIVEVFSKGFMVKDRVLRPAKVSVAK